MDAAADLWTLLGRREGHFALESGYHADLWLELDALLVDPGRLVPLAEALAALLKPHRPEVICGPLTGGAFVAQLAALKLGARFAYTERLAPSGGGVFAVCYRLPPALGPRVRGRRIAIVDDVISAGSATRATHAELLAFEALPVVAGALVVLGSGGADFFARHELPVEALARRSARQWLPAECPLCAAGVPLERGD